MQNTFGSFGELLLYLRQRARLSQRALGQAVGYTGAHITRLEKGMRRPDPMVVRARFIEALNLENEPALAQQLIALAAGFDGQTPEAPQNTVAPDESAPTLQSTNPGVAAPIRHSRAGLPAQVTSFIGREREMTEITRLLNTTRLLTLTGTGGTGKTRLAVQVGAALTQAVNKNLSLIFADGVWLVELAPVSSPEDVPRAVKEALQLPDELGRSLTDVLIDYLSTRCLLLLLDNCEHLISACAELVDVLLSACPNLCILATSREALRCSGEVVWRTPSLATPDPDSVLPLEQVATYEAVQLFAVRAVAAQSDFQLTQANAMVVARICARLDGIPLALEMAAARTATMSVQEIAAHLDDRFTLLTNGRRAALPRQRTLHAMLDWSYHLLTESERILLARLSVFANGCTAELAQTVCANKDDHAESAPSVGIAPSLPPSVVLHQSEILPLLTSLVGKSLAIADKREERTRYRLLETVRQYAAEKLAERNETDILYRRLAAYLTQPDIVMGGFYSPDWLRMFVAELGNLRSLIVWARLRRSYADIILRVACTFSPFSPTFGYVAEPLAWLEEGLATPEGVPISLRATGLCQKLWLLMCAGYNLSRWSAEADELMTLVDQLETDLNKSTAFLSSGEAAAGRGDLDAAEHVFEQMRTFSQSVSLRYGIGISLIHQSLVRVARGNKEGAAELLRQAYALGMDAEVGNLPLLRPAAMVWVDVTQALAVIERELSHWRNDKNAQIAAYFNHNEVVGMELQIYVQALLLSGDYAHAQTCALESLDLLRSFNLTWIHGYGIAEALLELGRIAWLRDDPGIARAYGEQCLDLYLRVGDMEHAAQAHTLVGYATLGQGDLISAVKSLRRGLSLFSELNQPAGIVVALAGLAATAEARGETERAVRLYGAADVPPESLLLWLTLALYSLRPASRVIYDRVMTAARKLYEDTAYTGWAEGKQMSLTQAVEYALAD